MRPSLSVIVELYNEAETPACVEFLRREVPAYDGPIEVVVVHDPATMSAAELARHFAGIEHVLVPAPGRRYYGMKNDGARAAVGELLLFVDSDTDPQPGFLDALVPALAADDVAAVGGVPIIGPVRDRRDRRYAAYWMFPEPEPPGQPYPYERFYGNSLTIRREEFLALGGFPEDDRTRGNCLSLSRRVRATGRTILRAPLARLYHPPPLDEGFVGQALRRGRDMHIGASDPLAPKTAMTPSSVLAYLREVSRRARALGSSPAERATTVLVAATDAVLVVIGIRVARHAPQFSTRFRS